ncbi:oxidoreductase [Bacillus timonensis]|uniref:oxidoreductase n=1 Tax=Bacillus timonensis TaxID=1033734 RepID=UPI000287AA79
MQFFSTYINRRDDTYGGSLEKSLTFPMAVVDKVKKVLAGNKKQPFIVGDRFSPEEPETVGITKAETLTLVNAFVSKELDYLHVPKSALARKCQKTWLVSN